MTHEAPIMRFKKCSVGDCSINANPDTILDDTGAYRAAAEAKATWRAAYDAEAAAWRAWKAAEEALRLHRHRTFRASY